MKPYVLVEFVFLVLSVIGTGNCVKFLSPLTVKNPDLERRGKKIMIESFMQKSPKGDH